MYLHEQTLADRFVFNYRKKIVSELDAVIDVKVEKEVVRYAGTGYQVVLRFDSGYSLAITSSCSYARSPCEHEEIVKQIITFLGLEVSCDADIKYKSGKQD